MSEKGVNILEAYTRDKVRRSFAKILQMVIETNTDIFVRGSNYGKSSENDGIPPKGAVIISEDRYKALLEAAKTLEQLRRN